MAGYELDEAGDRTVVTATGSDLGAALAAVADGVAAARWGAVAPATGERYDCAATAGDPDRLLYDYLDELDYQRDVRGVVPVDNAATVDRRGGRLRLRGEFAGARPDGRDERNPGPVAGSEGRVVRTGDGWRIRLVVD